METASASCPFGHQWEASLKVVNRGIERLQGRKPKLRIDTVVTPDRCPQCGHKWARTFPTQDDRDKFSAINLIIGVE